MKKLIAITLALVLVLALVMGSGIVLAKPNNNNNGEPKPGTDFNGPHYNLNIIGVPHDKTNGNFDNPKRHTIFIPLVTDYVTDPCVSTGRQETLDPTLAPAKGVKLKIGPSPDNNFYVIDGNATDDKYAEFLMPDSPGGYDVWVSGKGKPGGCLDIDAYYFDGTYYTFIGHVDVDRNTGQPKWQNVRWLLYYNGNAYFADYADYFWQLYNKGLRLMQVRFYPTPTT